MINTTISGNEWIFNPRDVNKSLSRANKDALRTMAHRIIDDTTEFVPMRDGVLRSSASIIEVGRDEISVYWERPDIPNSDADEAAELLWEGINPRTKRPVHRWTTEGTGGHWTEHAEAKYGDAWKDLFTYSWMQTFQKSFGSK